MHRTGIRAGLDVLRPTEARIIDHEHQGPRTKVIEGPVTAVERIEPAGSWARILVQVEGDDGWYALPETVETEPLT